MGDPKKFVNKFKTPVHPWQKQRLDEEKVLVKKYGLKNKKEIWKINSLLKKYKKLAKTQASRTGEQARVEKEQLVNKLKSYNLISTGNMDEVLGMKIEQLMDRRLQTVLVRLELARTAKQARQMIVHRHIKVNGKKITAPSYLVTMSEEGKIEFAQNSKFVDENHPERKKTEAEELKEQIAEIKSEQTAPIEEKIERDAVEKTEE